MASKIQITVLYFAQIREATKVKREILELSPNTTLKDLINLIHRRYPELRTVKNFKTSVNYHLVKPDAILKNEDEVALLPPISGG